MSQSVIDVRGAREHNLKNVSVAIPRGSLAVMTGVSGSGKSSLAFDTIHNEGQRRFLESLSSYARQFVGEIEKPDVDHIDGLSPTVSIDQKTVNRNPRSTVGTITEIYDHLRLLFARLGTPHCPGCATPIRAQTVDQIRDLLLADFSGRDLVLMAPIVKDRKGEYRKELDDLRLKGFVRARIDGKIHRVDEAPTLKRYVRHTIEAVIDRIKAAPEKASRLAEAVELSLKLGDGVMTVLDGEEHHTYSSKFACSACGTAFPDLEPRLFSFNSPHGACTACGGLGLARDIDPDLIVPDDSLTLRDGAIAPLGQSNWRNYGGVSRLSLESIASHFGFDLDTPWKDLDKKHRDAILYGSRGESVKIKTEMKGKSWSLKSTRETSIEGVVKGLRVSWKKDSSAHLDRFVVESQCGECGGSRLRKEALSVKFRGKTMADLVRHSVGELAEFAAGIEPTDRERPVFEPIMKELGARLGFLIEVGLGYVTIDRSAATLSGGESQRVRLATQVGSKLKGILYVLDEPSIGLHHRDNRALIGTLENLRDLGNTVCVVEHDQEMMERADFVVDVGPGAGVHGGEIVVAGSMDDLKKCARSITGAYLRGERSIPMPAERRVPKAPWLTIHGAAEHNLRGIDVKFPIGAFTVVAGVSGSGKSTLIDDILKRALARHFFDAKDLPGKHKKITGLEHIDKVIEIDRNPIGRTPRSNPATYTGVFDLIRDLYAALPDAQARGYKKGRFSFNVAGGRCETCGGAGVKVIAMQFLPDVETVCDACGGLRFNPETLAIKYRDKAINEVLDMTVETATEFFAHYPRIARMLQALLDVGLGYISLGQSATTLSGGEAQRLKLATELQRPATGRTLYLLDEPTTGLHFQDIEKLLEALRRLVDAKNTVIVVEHNLDVVKTADYIVELGPEGGSGGGKVVFEGGWSDFLKEKKSVTAEAMREFLAPPQKKKTKPRKVEDLGTQGALVVRGARTHNLRGVDVTIPSGKMTVVTGPSGSGKTSLAFDTIFAEGQRRFVESLSAYARQFLGRLDKAPVDLIDGLAPSIAIDQKNVSRNPRSTVATTTEIHDYLRLLYARVGVPHCKTCGVEIRRWSAEAIAADLSATLDGKKGRILAPLGRIGAVGKDDAAAKKPSAAEQATRGKAALADLKAKGFVRLLLNGEELRIEDIDPQTLAAAAQVEIVVDRVQVSASAKSRIAEAFEQAMREGGGKAAFLPTDGDRRWYAAEPGCIVHDHWLREELTPRMFSFNSLQGSCPSCVGVGMTQRCDVNLLVNEPTKPILGGAMKSKVGQFFVRKSYFRQVLRSLASHKKFDINAPWQDLSDADRSAIMNGIEGKLPFKVNKRRAKESSSFEMNVAWPGLRAYVEKWWHETSSGGWREKLAEVMRIDRCAACRGHRLKPEILAVTVGGQSIADIGDMTVGQAVEFFGKLELPTTQAVIADRIMKEIRARLGFLARVGLEYLSLDRSAATLSGGEAQRIRLATQIGSGLVGVIYVLDEPTIGLHQRDTQRLLGTLTELRDLGNTVIVVEHDEETIAEADWIIDMGPGAGHHGGQVVFQGARSELESCEASLTAAYLDGRKSVPPREERRPGNGKELIVRGARTNNLRDIDVVFPLGKLVSVTGVSGSGKSSLVVDTLVPAVEKTLSLKPSGDPVLKKLEGAKHIAELVVIDQAPIGRTPKSNPATYTGVFDYIRDVFALTPAAKAKGFGPGRFSFNASGGRCEACEGRGAVQVEMNFLADVWITCDVCRGRRYTSDTLTVEYRGKTIADVLEMEVGEAIEFFAAYKKITTILTTLRDVGLGYVKLGQPSNTLSGGEAQRCKLARELARNTEGHVLYVLDEPTTGLHFDDVAKLIGVLHRLVDAGHTVVTIEHNLDVVASSDHVIDLGPEGGSGGGQIVCVGTPEDVAAAPGSYTGTYLARHLAKFKKFLAPKGSAEPRKSGAKKRAKAAEGGRNASSS